MAEGGYGEDLSRSIPMGSEDGDLSRSIRMGSQESYEYYCQPCDVDHNQVEATFYCNNCQEYICKTCSLYHKRFQQLRDHNILDVRHMTDKPLITKNRPASTRAITMATHVKDIKMGFHWKRAHMRTTLMSTNQLLVADSDNNKVRLVDTVYGRQVSKLELSSRPWQVTRISDTEAAVTLPGDKKIVLVRTQPQLSVDREIPVQGECYGIVYIDNTLIVIFMEGNVDILDMSGKVLSTISTDQTGKKIFIAPHYITVDPVTGSRFVSDWGVLGRGSKVVKLSKEGSVEATYSGDRGRWPRQVALGTQGMIYVAWLRKYGSSWCVEQLSTNCDWVRTIVRHLAAPSQALSYDEATQQLYVGQNDGFVKVYKLS